MTLRGWWRQFYAHKHQWWWRIPFGVIGIALMYDAIRGLISGQ